MPKANLLLEPNSTGPQAAECKSQKPRVVRPTADISSGPRRRRSSDGSTPTIVHRLRDSCRIVGLARADALHISIMDAMDALFDAALRGISAKELNRRDKVRFFIGNAMSQTRNGPDGELKLIVEPKRDQIRLVFWSYPGVTITVLTYLTWDGQHGRRLLSIRCESHLMVNDSERDRCRDFFKDRRARLQAIRFNAHSGVGLLHNREH